MAKKDKIKGKDKKSKKDANYDLNIIKANISDLATECMEIFGANNNLMRHLPFVVDGLKPGERRILYTMYKETKAFYNGKYRKVAANTGMVLLYHPHGEAPVNETTVKLAQPWNNIECLVDGFGNFGSAKGENAAAARYIEARQSFYTHKCFFEEFSPDIVDMKPNYLGDRLEPEYLPSKYPNVLINNTFGIGYGVSCGLPTYNLREVIELTIKLMDDPDYEDITLVPDSPTGAYVIDEGQFQEISETGKGRFKMRGVIDIDEENNVLIIRSTPLQTNLLDIIQDIITLFEENKMQGFKEFRDDSDTEHPIDFKIYLKKEVDPVSIMHTIYAKTAMQKTFSVNYKLIDDYATMEYNIRSILLTWIDFRRETKRRYLNHTLIKNKERQHMLEILIFIFNEDNAEHTIRLIKKSETKKEAIQKIMKEYSISSLQATTILGMRQSEYIKEGYRKIVAEKKEVDAVVEHCEKMVRSQKKIDKEIRNELEECIELFGKDRLSKIITIDGEAKIRDTNHIVVFTMNGLVKKLPDKCTSIGFVNQGDYPIEIIEIRNTSDLLIFDESGKITKLPVHLLTNSDLNSEGEKLSKFGSISGKITTIIPKPTDIILSQVKEPIYFLMITKNGVIKKTLANNYTNIKNELLGLIVKEKDSLKSVKLLAGDKDVVIYTNKGYGVRISSTEIKETSRMSIGLKAIEMSDNEEVIGMDIVNKKDKFLFILSNKGNGKKCTLDNFNTMDRNSKPLRLVSLDSDEDVMMIKTVKGNEVFKAYLKNTVEEIKIEDVMELPRLSKGRKLIGVRKGEVIIDIKEVK